MVEGQNRLLPLPSVDADMSALLQREMKKRRIGCELGRTLKDVRVEGGMVRAMLGASPFIKEPTPAQMKETPIEAETVLVTVGRAPNTAGLGLAEAGVAVGTVVAIGFSPIVVALLGLIFLREKPAKAWYPATGLALIGLILLNADAVGGASFAGMAFPLLAGFSYACYFVFSKPLAQNAAPGSVMMVLCLLSGLCMLPVFWIYPAAWLATPVGALVALHLGVVTTAIAFSLTLAGLKVTPAATASTLSLAEPLSAACLGIFFLHEPLSLSAAVGIALIFGSVLILVACPSGQPPRESAARLRPQGR